MRNIFYMALHFLKASNSKTLRVQHVLIGIFRGYLKESPTAIPSVNPNGAVVSASASLLFTDYGKGMDQAFTKTPTE